MSRFSRIAMLVAVLVLAVPAPALAKTAPVTEYQLQFEPAGESSNALLVVGAFIDAQTSLPTSVTVPVPTGATLRWAGEIFGGDPANDLARMPAKTQSDGMDLYTFSAEKSHSVQVEVSLPAAKTSGRTLTDSLEWINPGPEVLVSGTVVAEAGAKDVKTTPKLSGKVQKDSSGSALYPLGGLRVAKGKAYKITAEWKRPKAKGSSSTPVLPVLIGGLVVAVLALVGVLVSERTRRRRAAAAE